MQFRVEIENVHPITYLVFEIDLSQQGIHCIVGENGTGKTTLAKAILNLALADTFVRTSSDGVFNESSTIPQRPPKVLHLWPPKLLHPGHVDLTH